MAKILKRIRRTAANAARRVADVLEEPEFTDSQRERNRLIDAMVAAGRKFKEAFKDIDEDGPQYIWGDQTRKLKVKDGWTPVQDNQIFPLLAQAEALQAVRRPTLGVSAKQPKDVHPRQPTEEEPLSEEETLRAAALLTEVELAGQAKRLLLDIFDNDLDIPMMRIDVQPDLHAYGYCVVAPYWDDRKEWDRKARRWIGHITADIIDPKSYYRDGQVDSRTRPQFEFTQTKIAVKKALQRWTRPGDKEIIIRAARKQRAEEQNKDALDGNGYAVMQASGSTSADTLTASRVTEIGHYGNDGRLLKAITGAAGVNPPLAPEGSPEAYPAYVTMLDLIYEDYAEIDEVEQVPEDRDKLVAQGRMTSEGGFDVDPKTHKRYNPDTWPKREVTRTVPKYPWGRHIIRFGRDGVIHDKPWSYAHPRWVIGRMAPLPHTWRGRNAVEMAKGAQDEINVDAMHLMNWIRNQADSGWIVEEGAFPDDPTNLKAGEKMKSRPGHMISVKENKLNAIKPREVPVLPRGLLELTDRASEHLKNAVGIHDTLAGRIRAPKTTATETVHAEQNDRIRTGLAANFLDRFTIDVIRAAWSLARVHFTQDDAIRILGDVDGAEFPIERVMLSARFELNIEVAEELPYDRERRKADALELFDKLAILGMPDLALEWLVKAFDTPDAEELLLKIKERQEALAKEPAPGQKTSGGEK